MTGKHHAVCRNARAAWASMLLGSQAAEAGTHPEPTKARVMPDSSFMTFLMMRGAVKTWSRVCVTPCLHAWELCFRKMAHSGCCKCAWNVTLLTYGATGKKLGLNFTLTTRRLAGVLQSLPRVGAGTAGFTRQAGMQHLRAVQCAHMLYSSARPLGYCSGVAELPV